MTEAAFIGREVELEELKQQTKKKIASLIVIKGRRRIGKSRLIEKFCANFQHYVFAGIAPTDKTSKQSQAGRVVIVLDEIQWIGSEDADFLGKLKNAWDLHFKKNPKLILIICGSASAWIDKNILSSTAFMGRVSYTLSLDELPLSDCNAFWNGNGSQFSPYDKFKLLSVIGGIPDEMKNKISRLYVPNGMSCCPVLIHVNGVNDSIIDSGYFTEIIDFGDVLK